MEELKKAKIEQIEELDNNESLLYISNIPNYKSFLHKLLCIGYHTYIPFKLKRPHNFFEGQIIKVKTEDDDEIISISHYANLG